MDLTPASSEPLVGRVASAPAAAAHKGASVCTTIISLIATTMGAGILSLPISLSYGGLLPGMALLVCFAVASDTSLNYLIEAGNITGAKS